MEIITPAVIIVLCLLYVIFIRPMIEEKRKLQAYRDKVHGFICGFMISSHMGASSEQHIADIELDRVFALKKAGPKSRPTMGEDPLYHAENYAQFGLLCIQKYARENGMDKLLESCRQFENEVRRAE